MNLLLLMVLGLLTATAQAGKYPPSTVSMTLQQVSDRCYYVQGEAGTAIENEGFISNAGVVVTEAGVVVIDALGSPSLAQLLMERIREVTDKPVVKVILTHYHADHVFGLQYFKEMGAEIIAPDGAEKYLESPASKERLEERRFSLEPWVNEDTRLVWPERFVEKHDVIQVGDTIFEMTVIGDAHSDADMTIYVKSENVLYSGDVIFEGRIPFLGSSNTRLWLETLKRMDSGDLKALVPGHGPHQEAPVKAIGLTYRYLAFLREKMGEAVDELVPFDEAYAEADWSGFRDLPAFDAANRRNAYQVYLSMQNEAFAD
ncbi:MAG: MBL fold metallo-hydrolase [Gammaproteobacteria bacterium]|nr:MBL fold metallo-hydrolase [Gammaproteobacteria bacterium]MCW8840507.1 MBL fold metallo-hydrolase [Gammaproteobacteria bacterium]MCW8927893.1 MBL fold metallo-hydrolase [Gammaproteobacteria bacterium]MCW8958673.1 MBL fold metallo-hydrolase [Gammaproteobacteria bacterium]MCW8973083.1 MBL fold metallo-hydrolase [Gammaproteobacteria bacterium]